MKVLDSILNFSKFGLSDRTLAEKLGVYPALISRARKNKGGSAIRALLPRALNDLRRELAATAKADPQAPKCPRCQSPMVRNAKRSHWFHGRLAEYWTCRRHCNAGIFGRKLLRGGSAGPLIRLDRAQNPNTGQEVSIPWRHDMSSYEIRHGPVWCDQTSNRPEGCGRIMRHERTVRYANWSAKFAIFTCYPGCPTYRRRYAYCSAGRAYSKPRTMLKSKLPQKAWLHTDCGGRVYRKMGRTYATSNPWRHARRELIRCSCSRCGKTLYFNRRKGTFEHGLRAGPPPVEDLHRPHCRKCGSVTRWALRVHAFRKKAPNPVRFYLEGTNLDSLRRNEVLAVKYRCSHFTIWKTPDGKIIPGSEWRRGDSLKSRRVRYEVYKRRRLAKTSESQG